VKGTTTSDHQPRLIDRGAPIPPKTPEELCKNFDGYSIQCLDCTTLVHCYGNPQQSPYLVKCGGEYPYCDSTSNFCTENPNPFSCGIDNFACTKPDGVFPHPTNCSLFYVCENSYANLFECSPNQVWSGNGMVCKDKTCPSDCGTFNC
uniref:Uncharacterized protein n=1 Tax=Phlebotomus papatasi TaxID=29031 RepID=A0A1B0D4B4_PHLPP